MGESSLAVLDLSETGQLFSWATRGWGMSQRAVEHLIGRLITDDQFRRKASTSLAVACCEVGLELTPGEMVLLSHLELGCFSDLSRSLDPGLRRTGSRLGK